MEIDIHKETKLTKRDTWLIILLTLIYSDVAFYQLGDMDSPKTAWKPSIEGESFDADFGEAKLLEKVIWFGGIGDGKLRIAYSLDE
ncbi:hypothetical protein [Paenibacillus sp. N3.4]|uniref:hypothetical protein n=1 Tax=Paenibacillus sp. N3.4 TaxID=2603222 RepID=UPI0016504864|nr:hypothetical protein [Paenibacillus sp. N3.4]